MIAASLAAALSLLLAEPPAAAAEARELVGRLVDAVERNDRPAFDAIAPNAMIGVNDVGGPMTMEVLAALRGHCVFERARESSPPPMPGFPALLLVDTDWQCAAQPGGEARRMSITFMVERGRVRGAYIASVDRELMKRRKPCSIRNLRIERLMSGNRPEARERWIGPRVATRLAMLGTAAP